MPVPGPKQVLSNKTADPQAGQLIPPDGLELRENHTFDRLQMVQRIESSAESLLI